MLLCKKRTNCPLPVKQIKVPEKYNKAEKHFGFKRARKYGAWGFMLRNTLNNKSFFIAIQKRHEKTENIFRSDSCESSISKINVEQLEK